MRTGRRRVATIGLGGLLAWVFPPSPAGAAPPPSLETIPVGGSIGLRIDGPEAARRFSIPAGAPGPLTVVATSIELDPSIVVSTEDGRVLGQDDDSGTYLDAWLTVTRTASVGLTVDLRIAGDRRGAGEVELRVLAGTLAPPTGRAAAELEAERFEEIGRAALAHDEAARAGRFLLAAGARRRGLEEFSLAVALLTDALEPCRLAGATEDEAKASLLLGMLQERFGRLEVAERLLERAADRFDTLRAEEAPVAWDRLGLLRLERGDAEGARTAFLRAAATAEAIPRESLVALAVAGTGLALERRGDIGSARSTLAEALARIEALSTPDPAVEAYVLLRVGEFHARRAELEPALEALDRADRVAPRSAHDRRIEILLRRARVLAELGRPIGATQSLERARSLTGTRTDPRLLHLGGDLAILLGEPELARATLERAAASPFAGPHRDLLGEITVSLGHALIALGRPEEARTAISEFLSREDAGRSSGLAFRLTYNLARADEELSDLQAAAEGYARAGRIATGADLGSLAARADAARAWVACRRGDLETARALARAAREVLETNGEVDAVLAVLHTLGTVALAERDFEATRDALAAARAVLDRDDLRRLGPLRQATLRSRFASLSELGHDLAALESRRSPRDAQRIVARGLADAARWKGRTILDSLAARDRGAPAESASLDALRRSLGDGRTLLEYVEGTERLYAYRVSATDAALVDLGRKAPLLDRARSYRRGIDGSRALAPARRVVEEGRALAAAVLAPALGDGAAEDLVIAPAGALATLPFEALVLAADPADDTSFDGVTFVADAARVTYTPSAVVFSRLSTRPPAPDREQVLFLADAVFSRELLEGGLPAAPPDWLRLDRLEQTRPEVLTIARALLASRAGAAPDETSARLTRLEFERSGALTTPLFFLGLGSEATAAALSAHAETSSILHVATHGHVDLADPRRSGLVLTYDDRTGGLFSLEDVLRLDLDARLVVLSACDTAHGRLVRGEGLQSLAHAFLVAGSRAVIASLWKVEDAEASSTMRRFYAAMLVGGDPPAVALRRAKAAMRREGPRAGRPLTKEDLSALDSGHPYYWAPFVHTGSLAPMR